jgi:hypothetical protein
MDPKLQALMQKWRGYDDNLPSSKRKMMEVEVEDPSGKKTTYMTAPPDGWRHESEPRDDMDMPKGAGERSASMKGAVEREALDALMVKHGADVPPMSKGAKDAMERFNKLPTMEQMERADEFRSMKKLHDEGQKAPRSYPPKHPSIKAALMRYNKKDTWTPEDEEEFNHLMGIYQNGSTPPKEK